MNLNVIDWKAHSGGNTCTTWTVKGCNGSLTDLSEEFSFIFVIWSLTEKIDSLILHGGIWNTLVSDSIHSTRATFCQCTL